MAYRSRVFPGALFQGANDLLSNSEPVDAPFAAITKWAKAEYDFATDGGLISKIGLGVNIPDDAICIGAYMEVITAVTSGGAATVSVGAGAAPAGFIAATGKASWTTGAVLAGAAVAAAPFKAPAASEINITVATAALTAGKFNVWVEYLSGEA